MEIECFEPVSPTENNRFGVFSPSLENDCDVWFISASGESLGAVITDGIKALYTTKKCLVGSIGKYPTSYKSSAFCLAGLGELESDLVIFAVTTEEVDSQSEFIDLGQLVPQRILGFVYLPKGSRLERDDARRSVTLHLPPGGH